MDKQVALIVCLVILGLFVFFRIIFVCQKRASGTERNNNSQTIECPPPATHITVPPSPTTNQMDHGMIFPGVLHMEPQLNPPPYTAVALPPSYDEAIKQTSVNCNIAIANSSSREANKY